MKRLTVMAPVSVTLLAAAPPAFASRRCRAGDCPSLASDKASPFAGNIINPYVRAGEWGFGRGCAAHRAHRTYMITCRHTGGGPRLEPAGSPHRRDRHLDGVQRRHLGAAP